MSYLCIIIGDPVEHSLSPIMHNAGYQALGLEQDYRFFKSQVPASKLKDFMAAVRLLPIKGLTCTIPHKVSIMDWLDDIDPIAKSIGAVNTVVNKRGRLIGYNTDWLGTVIPLQKMTSLEGKKVALLGAGGAARAMAFGVATNGAKLTIFNRSLKKAQTLADEIGYQANADLLSNWEMIREADIIINATSIGLGQLADLSPVPKEAILKKHIVFDAVYGFKSSKLINEAQDQGARTIDGLEMLLYQGMVQFNYYTGKIAPEALMRQALVEALKK